MHTAVTFCNDPDKKDHNGLPLHPRQCFFIDVIQCERHTWAAITGSGIAGMKCKNVLPEASVSFLFQNRSSREGPKSCMWLTRAFSTC
eukprot:1157408-Pelagomonas_calceolata.AAC.15